MRLTPLYMIVTLALLVATGPGSMPAHAQDAPTIEATDDFTFVPDEITVEAGTTISWTNIGDAFHTVTSTDSLDEPAPNGIFDQNLPGGESFSFAFDQPGTYHYYCKPHVGQGMTGTVIVTEAGDDGDGADTGADNGGGDNADGDDTADSPGIGVMPFLVMFGMALVAWRKR